MKKGLPLYIAISGPIGAGKTTAVDDAKDYINNKKEYVEKNFKNLSIYNGLCKTFPEIPDPKVLKEYYKVIFNKQDEEDKLKERLQNYVACAKYDQLISFRDEKEENPLCEDEFVKDLLTLVRKEIRKYVISETQWEFLANKLIADVNKAQHDGLCLGDKMFSEDKVFFEKFHNEKDIDDLQYSIYMKFYNVLKKYVKKPDYIIYFDIKPENAIKNVKERIEKRKKLGLDTSGEELIDVDYLKVLQQSYDKWIERRKKEYSDKFIVVDCNQHRKIDEILKIMDDIVAKHNN